MKRQIHNLYNAANEIQPAYKPSARNAGIVLILTLVTLVLLTTIVYTLSSRIAINKHRQLYIINYQSARYACDSAMKYALAAAQEMPVKLKPTKTPEELYDFSDLFHLSYDEYQQLIYDTAVYQAQTEMASDGSSSSKKNMLTKKKSFNPFQVAEMLDIDPNSGFDFDLSSLDSQDDSTITIDPNNTTIPGPYGPPWPYVIDPIEFNIGQTKITITIEDENAKFPLVWALTTNPKQRKLARESFEVFCEWMNYTPQQIDILYKQLNEIAAYKSFKTDLKPIVTTTTVKSPSSTSRYSSRYRRTSSRLPSRGTPRVYSRTRTIRKTRPTIAHNADFARLLHFGNISPETLAEPAYVYDSQSPNENYQNEQTDYEEMPTEDYFQSSQQAMQYYQDVSALKYIGLWGAWQVNINTAPRHVLEAAFTFGGKAPEIAEAIIQRRKQKPFASIDQLISDLYQYADSIKKAKPYITTNSTIFTIKVTAVSGNAVISEVAGIYKQGKSSNNYVCLYNESKTLKT